MIGGTRYPYVSTTEYRAVTNDTQPSTRTMQMLNVIKQQGEISASELAKELGIDAHLLRMSICNATLCEGSKVYEYMKKGRLIFGWLQ